MSSSYIHKTNHNIVLVRSWFCIVYEVAKPRVDYANQDLTISVPIIVDPLTYQ